MTSIIGTRRNKDIKTSKVKLPEEISKLYKSDFKSRETQLIIKRDGFKYFPIDNYALVKLEEIDEIEEK